MPPPPALIEIQMAKAYMKQIGLDAWYDYFQKYIPATVKTIAKLQAVTEANLKTLGEGANMALDAATVKQVMGCLEIGPIDEFVNIPWVDWAKREWEITKAQKARQQARAKIRDLELKAAQAVRKAAQEARQAQAQANRDLIAARKAAGRAGKKPRKAKPDASLPKKPKGRLSAYMYFSKELRPSVVAKQPELEKNVTAQGKLLGQMWRELSDEGKAPFTKLAASDAGEPFPDLSSAGMYTYI